MRRERSWVLECGHRYWRDGRAAIAELEIPDRLDQAPSHEFTLVELPDWAVDVGSDGAILVDRAMLACAEGPAWRRCDWIGAAFLHLSCAFEWDIESRIGPVHSYSFRFGEHDRRLFDRAWVNRIYLFLRRWRERASNVNFAPLPATEIVLTHDVDALEKTLALRIKQSAFYLFNSVRALPDIRTSLNKLQGSVRFACLNAKFDTFATIRSLEERAGIRSLFHIYGGPPGWKRASVRRYLMDPAYDLKQIAASLRELGDDGWRIGLHQSFDAWNDPAPMALQKQRIENAIGTEVRHCRQHWLRFSLAITWKAQEMAGLSQDSTLGFNDRPGFRNGAALQFRPWHNGAGRPLAIEVMPMVLMDSHLYDYRPQTESQRYDTIASWLSEIRAVRGQATVNWHTHTITDAYGWGDGFRALLSML